MYEDLVSGRYKRHMAQLSRRPDQLKRPLLWKNGIVESCVWMAAGCYFEWPSFCCFTLKKVWPQSRSKEIVSLRHLVRWRKKDIDMKMGSDAVSWRGTFAENFHLGLPLMVIDCHHSGFVKVSWSFTFRGSYWSTPNALSPRHSVKLVIRTMSSDE